MSDTTTEISIKHGRTMYIMGIKHAVSMVETGGLEVIAELKAKIDRENKELEDMEHSRYNFDHYKNCQDCMDDHMDAEQEAIMEAKMDAAMEGMEG